MAVAAAGVAAWAAANAGTIAAVSAAASVAATSYSVYAQRQSAQAESDAQSAQNKETAKQAAASYDDLSPAEIDAINQANQADLAQQADAIQAKGRVNLFAAASGTAGGSVDSMLFDIDAVEGRNINQILAQRESGLLSIKNQAESVRQQAISGQSRTAIDSPSWLEGGLKIGTAAVNGLQSYNTIKTKLSGLDKASTSTTSQAKGSV